MVLTGQLYRDSAGDTVPVDFNLLPEQIRPVIFAPSSHELLLLTGDSWAPVMCTLINSAQRSIYLAAYSVSTRWPKYKTDKFNVYQALLGAPARGVRCRCVLATHKRTAATSRFNTYAALAMAEKKWTVRRAPRGRLLHLKMMIVDDYYVVVGSHNIAHAAASSNIDLSLCLSGAESVRPFLDLFYNLYADASMRER